MVKINYFWADLFVDDFRGDPNDVSAQIASCARVRASSPQQMALKPEQMALKPLVRSNKINIFFGYSDPEDIFVDRENKLFPG